MVSGETGDSGRNGGEVVVGANVLFWVELFSLGFAIYGLF